MRVPVASEFVVVEFESTWVFLPSDFVFVTVVDCVDVGWSGVCAISPAMVRNDAKASLFMGLLFLRRLSAAHLLAIAQPV